MTKKEFDKCEEMLMQGIRCGKKAITEFSASQKYEREGKIIDSLIEQRKADQHTGEATGIYTVLVNLNFKHPSMAALFQLI